MGQPLSVDGLMGDLVAHVRDGIVVTDLSSQTNEIVFANPAFLKMLGYRENDIVGQGTRSLLGKQTRPSAAQTFRRAIAKKLECLVTVSVLCRDGSERWLEVSGSPLMLPGQPPYYVGICRDVSQRVSAFQAVLESEIFLAETGPENTGNEMELSIDALTSLYNRNYFEEYAEREWSMMTRQHLPITLFMLGLKGLDVLVQQGSQLSEANFKEAVADRIRGLFRRGTDLVAHFDDTRFVMISAGMGWEEAELMSNRLYQQVSDLIRQLTPHVRTDQEALNHAAVGVSTSIPEEGHAIDALIQAAEMALLDAFSATGKPVVMRSPL